MDDRIRDWPEVATNIGLRRPIEWRLQQLLDRLDDEAQERTSRRELISALILAAPESGASLSRLIKRYRAATARQAIVGDELPTSITELPRPRKRARSA
jgi:hypothetical protein